MRKISTTVILSAAVAATLLALGVIRARDAESAAAKARSNRLFSFPFADADAIMVSREGWTNSLYRQNSAWHVDGAEQAHSPSDAGEQEGSGMASMAQMWNLADGLAVQRLLDSLEAAPVIETISARDQAKRGLPRDLFGLDAPTATVAIASGFVTNVLEIGAPAPITNQVFVSFLGGGDVFVTSSEVLDCVPRDETDLRDRSFAHFDPKQVDCIEMSRPGMDFVRIQRMDGDWFLALPFPAPADNEAIASIVSSVCSARIAEFLGKYDTPGLSSASGGDAFESIRNECGLADDAVNANGEKALRIVLRGANGAEEVVRLGKPVPSLPGTVHALAPDESTIVAVTNRIANLALAPLPALRARTVFPSKIGSVDSLSIRRPGQSFSLRRDFEDAGKWHLTRPVEALADQGRVSRLLDGILGLRAAEIVDERHSQSTTNAVSGTPVSPVELGLGTNREQVCTVEIVADGNPAALQVVRSPDHAGVIGLAFDGAKELYLMPQTNLPSMLLNPIDLGMLRDKSIWSIDQGAITRVTVSCDGSEPVSVERDPLVGWSRKQGGASLDVEGFRKLVGELAELSASRVISLERGFEMQAGGDAGTTAPWMELTLGMDSQNKVLTIYGPTENGGRSARFRGHDALFELSPETIDILSRLRIALGLS